MKRNRMHDLIQWNQSSDKKPMILYGIKGAGKTYLALDFAKSFFEGSIYVNFENNAVLSYLFQKNEKNGQNKDFYQVLCEHYQIPKELLPGILIIIDEMQTSPSAYLSFLQTAGKTKGISCILITSEQNSFQEQIFSGFQRIRLFPLEFDEFLTANGYEWYVEVIKAHTKSSHVIPEIVHKELLVLFDDYLEVGGMPAAVNEYLGMESAENVGQIHQNIFRCIQMYNIDKYSESHSLKMKQIYSAMENQILKEHPKFQYRPIRRGATYAMFKDAIHDLRQSGQLLKCNKMQGFEKQKIQYDESSFKLYYFDTGILHFLMNQNQAAVLLEPEKKKKILLSNYITQCLTGKGYRMYFWESGSQARVDFIVRAREHLLPIEIQIQDSKRSKSLSILKRFYNFPYYIKLSSKNFDFTDQVKMVPHYALFSIMDDIKGN